MRRTHSLTLRSGAGGGGSVIQLSGSYDAINFGDGASVTFKSDGSVSVWDGGVTTVYSNAWLVPNPDSTTAALYEIRRTQIAGSGAISFTGTMSSGTWYPLTADRGVIAAYNGLLKYNESTWDIRLAGGPGTILATCNTYVESNP